MEETRRHTFVKDGRRPFVRKDQLLLAGVLLVAFTVRLIYVWQYRSNPLFEHPVMDALYHDRWARDFAAGRSFMEGMPFFRAPLYPWLLGLCY